MKRLGIVQSTLSLVLMLACSMAFATDKKISIYNWSDYIAKDTVPNFVKETGIQVHYDVFDSDDTLQAKLLSGKAGYDIVVPSSPYMAKQISAGVYQKLDKSKIPNLANLDPALMKILAQMDPKNSYGVPYAFGTTGLGYNITKAKKVLGAQTALDNWDIAFKPENIAKLKSCGVSVLDSPSEILPVVLHYIGKAPNSKNPSDYFAAFEVLKKIRPFITQFNSSGYINDLANGDICFALGWSGDINIASKRARDAKRPYEVRYFIPKSGAPIWFDLMAIPKDADHIEAAYQWINYILRPEVHAAISNEVFYPNANLASHKYLNPELLNNPTVHPNEAVMKTLYIEREIPAEILRLENRLWTQLKTHY